jgi:hypothetical protein
MTSAHLPFFSPSSIFLIASNISALALFHRAGGLGVVYRREYDLCSNILAEIFEHYAIKVHSIVNCDAARDTVSADDIRPEEFSDRCIGYIHEGLRLYPFCEVFNCHDGESVIALRGG